MSNRLPIVLNAGKHQALQSADTLQLTNLTATRVPFVAAGPILSDSASLTWNGTALSTPSIYLSATTSGTSGVITQGGVNLIHTFAGTGAGGNFFIGPLSGNYTLSTAQNNLGWGFGTLFSLTTGYFNIAMLGFAGGALTEGYDNIYIGYYSGNRNITGYRNTGIGATTLLYHKGYFSTAIGYAAGAGTNGVSTSFAVYIGAYAGCYETAASKLYIDSLSRATEAGGRTLSLIYGGFADAIANQFLTINGRVGVNLPPTAWLTLQAGLITAGYAPLKFTSGTSLTTAVAGAMEFTTDDLFFTITTGPVRCGVILNNGTNLTTGKIPIATTNGRLIDGQTPLSGTKTYTVLNRTITFTNGILTGET